MQFVATVPSGLEQVLAQELEALGIVSTSVYGRTVEFDGDLEAGYRVCLWSRTASRVLLVLGTFQAADASELYEGARTLRWTDHLGPEATLAVDAVGETPGLENSHFAMLRLKDAIVDQIRDETGQRPSVQRATPDVRVNLYLHDGTAQIAIDLSGDSLHRRGYRGARAAAPLKENLAAGLLHLAGWPEACSQGAPLVDPMCGTGTLLIEGALIAADVAPGLLRSRFGFSGWLGHQADCWSRLLAQASQRDRRKAASSGSVELPSISGYDSDPDALRGAEAAIRSAALVGLVRVESRRIDHAAPPAETDIPGLLIVNPPYGHRLGEAETLGALYRNLGTQLRQRFRGWRACVLSADAELSRCIGLKSTRRHSVYNGAIACKLLEYPIAETAPAKRTKPRADKPPRVPRSDQAEAFANRLRKNARHMGRWAGREGIVCYRVYDADIPEYAAAIDLYDGWAHVQEYAPPSRIDPQVASDRLHDMELLTAEVLDIAPQDVHVKVRRRQQHGFRYGKQSSRQAEKVVEEAGLRFRVNLTDYLDTGLFLDQRNTRALLQAEASGRRFLNLFCYTASATVYAIKGGAVASTSVDMSSTYLDWARDNLQLNGIGGSAHQLERADCLRWLQRHRGSYDLIYLDPPTFSNSKSMRETLDIQRDHVELLRSTLRLLEPSGAIVFATNRRDFKLDRAALHDLRLEDLSRSTLPHDFARNARIRQVWRIRRN